MNIVTNNTSAIESRLTDSEEDITTLQADVDTAESDITTLQTDLDTAESNISTLQTGLASTQSNVTALQGDIVSIQNTLAATASDVVILQDEVASLQAGDSAQDAAILSLQGTVGDNDTVIDNLSTDVTALEGDVTALQTDVTTLQSDLTTLEGSVTTIEGDITTLQGVDTSLDSRLDTAENDITTIEGNITTLQGVDTSLDNRLDNAENSITSIGSDVDSLLGVSTQTDLQNALTNDKTIGKGTVLAGGELTLTSTLNIVDGAGGMIVGQGSTEPITYSGGLQKVASRIIVGGTRDYTAINYNRQEFALENLCIAGATRAQIDAIAAKAPTCIKMDRATGAYSGIGSGKLHVRNVHVSYFDIAFDIGDVGDSNCDESFYQNLSLHKIGTGFRVNNLQGLGHLFSNLRCHDVTKVFDFKGGGDFKIYGALMVFPGTWMNFSPTDDLTIGPNTAMYVTKGLKVDSQANGSKMVDMTAGRYYDADVKFEDLHFPAGWTGTNTFSIAGRTTLTIYGAKNLTANMFKWTAGLYKTNIRLRDCQIYGSGVTLADLFNVEESQGNCPVEATGCIDHGGNVLSTYSATLAGLA